MKILPSEKKTIIRQSCTEGVTVAYCTPKDIKAIMFPLIARYTFKQGIQDDVSLPMQFTSSELIRDKADVCYNQSNKPVLKKIED